LHSFAFDVMECTLDLYTDYLLISSGLTTATGLSALHDQAVSHDKVTRFLTDSYLDSRDVWRAAKPLIRQAEACKLADDYAVLVVDDCIAEKAHTDANALIATYWDHSKKRYVRGVNFVTLFYHLGSVSVPLSVTLVEKTAPVPGKPGSFCSPVSKNEHLRQMLQVAHQQVAYKYVLGDSWYASAENMTFIMKTLGRDFVFAVESSRTVALSMQQRAAGEFMRLDALDFSDNKPKQVYLRSVKEAVLLVRQVFTNGDGSQGVLYLISSDTNLDYAKMTAIYKKRWKVEEYHKSLKQNASLTKSPTKKIGPQANHFFASFLAYLKLEALKLRHNVGHFRLKAQLYMAGLKAMDKELIKMSA
jgi:hypothetical protein